MLDVTTHGRETTADDVLAGMDLSGRTVVVTGASGGLGEETARALAAHGATVVMAARRPDANAEAMARIRARHPEADLHPVELDLASLASVARSAEAVLAAHPSIDVLVNSAGVMCAPFGHTADGFETHFGTNHLGHFAFTRLLAPGLAAGVSSRVVTVSSAAHSISDVDLDDPNFERTEYDEWVAYGRSKTANALFSVELSRRVGDQGVLALTVHPGTVMTDLYRHATPELLADAAERSRARAAEGEDGSPFLKTVEQGAATQVWAAVAGELDGLGGAYLADCQLAVEGANPSGPGYLPYAVDPERAARLWTLSESLIGW
jgi:NAD(P)-dependent dehydrogenase (short-subunit alcohol dehydrogenase family)